MSLTLADQYYIKAIDNYPYNLEESVENLNYALSYGKDHAGVNCLMGRFYFEQLKDLETAEYYFQNALASDLSHLDTFVWYSMLLIQQRKFSSALKLINQSYKIKGVDLSVMFRLKALVYEYQKQYKKSIQLLKKAYQESFNEEDNQFIKSEIARVKKKLKI